MQQPFVASSSQFPDPKRFFQDSLNRQGLLIESFAHSSEPNFVNPLNLLSRDQLISLWESCSPDEPESSRLSKAVSLHLRDRLVNFVAKSQIPLNVPFLSAVRRLGVKEAVEFASLSRDDLCRVVLNS